MTLTGLTQTPDNQKQISVVDSSGKQRDLKICFSDGFLHPVAFTYANLWWYFEAYYSPIYA